MTTVSDRSTNLDDFVSLLSAADDLAYTDWQRGFLEGLRYWYEDYGDEMFLAESQLKALEKIAGRL